MTNLNCDPHHWLRQKIETYLRQGDLSPARRTQAEETLAFVNKYANCFSRENQMGHITGSSLIINEDATHTLLHHHRKIDKWIQLGGHSDDDSNTLRVALKEAEEESGLKGFRVVSENIFDIDVHDFPAIGDLNAHRHYDIRFLLQISSDLPLQKVDRESKDLAWIPVDQVLEDDNFTLVQNLVRCLDGYQIPNI